MFVGEAGFGIQISQLNISIAKAEYHKKQVGKSTVWFSNSEGIQVKSTVFGTADGKLALDQKLVAATK